MDRSLENAVTRQIRIEARPELVFQYFTDPAKMTRWMGLRASLNPQPGGIYRVEVSPRDLVEGQYVEVTPYSRIVFTWGWPGENSPVPPGASTVEVSFVPDGAATIVILRHIGLPVDQRASHAEGWDHYLARLILVGEEHDPGPDPWAN